MFIFKHGGRQAFNAVRRSATQVPHRHASRIAIPFTPPPFPVTESCPAPTCTCRDQPPNLDIEREQNINGSMAAYAEQVLISTGRHDWKSKIEDDEDAILVRELKENLTRGGKYVDPYHNILITNSSFPSTPPSPKTASAYLLPSFKHVPNIPLDPASIETFIRAYLLPEKLHPSHPPAQTSHLLRDASLQAHFPHTRPVEEILILICGHNARDSRCGILGPILQAEFEDKLASQANINLVSGDAPTSDNQTTKARVGLISHIGGHKWAGNVIVYLPPTLSGNALKGKGIWYGRVEPKYVEGIVKETILGGRVIKELFRGGVGQGGEVLRL